MENLDISIYMVSDKICSDDLAGPPGVLFIIICDGWMT
jgi:hypothetical protein